MIFGSVTINKDAVTTHRDTYLLKNISVVSVRRPFIAPALLVGGGLAGFGLVFADLLYPGEVIATTAFGIAAILIGWQAGQLKLLSRDLRGSDLSDAIWGQYCHLNQIRRDIVRVLHSDNSGDVS